jgi:hypothetical protein
MSISVIETNNTKTLYCGQMNCQQLVCDDINLDTLDASNILVPGWLDVSGDTTLQDTAVLGTFCAAGGNFDFDSFGNLQANGTLTLGSTAAITGNLTVGSSRFTANATTGNTLCYGSFQAHNGNHSVLADVSNIQFWNGLGGDSGFNFIVGSEICRVTTTSFRPSTDNMYDFGSLTYRFQTVYAGTGSINTSDQTLKTDISGIEAQYGLELINHLAPKRFKFVDGTSGRFHYGLLAQDVETVMVNEYADVSLNNSAMVCMGLTDAGEERYGLRNSELIPSLILACQQLSAQVVALEARVADLEMPSKTADLINCINLNS